MQAPGRLVLVEPEVEPDDRHRADHDVAWIGPRVGKAAIERSAHPTVRIPTGGRHGRPAGMRTSSTGSRSTHTSSRTQPGRRILSPPPQIVRAAGAAPSDRHAQKVTWMSWRSRWPSITYDSVASSRDSGAITIAASWSAASITSSEAKRVRAIGTR